MTHGQFGFVESITVENPIGFAVTHMCAVSPTSIINDMRARVIFFFFFCAIVILLHTYLAVKLSPLRLMCEPWRSSDSRHFKMNVLYRRYLLLNKSDIAAARKQLYGFYERSSQSFCFRVFVGESTIRRDQCWQLFNLVTADTVLYIPQIWITTSTPTAITSESRFTKFHCIAPTICFFLFVVRARRFNGLKLRNTVKLMLFLYSVHNFLHQRICCWFSYIIVKFFIRSCVSRWCF